MRGMIVCSAIVVAACHAPTPVSPSLAVSMVEGRGPNGAPAPNPARSPAETQELTDLLQETLRVIRLPSFERNLGIVQREFGLIRQSATGQGLTAERVAQLYAGRDPGYVFHPAAIDWGSGSATTRDGMVRLSTNARDYWRTGRPLGRSLAINTLAHELSHTLSSAPAGDIRTVFSDNGYSSGWLRRWPPLVSYSIGSVAQCTYLEEQNALRGSIADCLRRYGVAKFTTYRNDNWDVSTG